MDSWTLVERLPRKLNGSDLSAVREDFGWWVGYESKNYTEEISASGKTLEEAFTKLYDYWFKGGRWIKYVNAKYDTIVCKKQSMKFE